MRRTKRAAIVLLTLATMVLAAVLPMLSLATPAAAGTRNIDVSTGATPNYKTSLISDIKGMPVSGGNYTCLKAQAPYTYFTQDWYGVSLDYFLNVEVGMKADTTAVKFIADDGYSVSLTPAQISMAYPSGLSPMLGYRKGAENTTGGNLTDLDATEGPCRLIVPQAVIGDQPSGGTPNWNMAVQRIRAIEVQPTPPGLPAFDYTKAPTGQVTVYGNILNRTTITAAQVKSIKQVTATVPWKSSGGTGTTTFIGIPMSYLINTVAGARSGWTSVKGVAGDGFSRTYTADQVNNYIGGLNSMVVWNDGADLTPAPGAGPLELIRPQANPSDSNKGQWVKNLRVLQLLPLDAQSTPAPDATKVPSDRIIITGLSSPNNVPSTWYLAEGYTGPGFEEFICIENPNPWKTPVEIEYMIQGEGNKTQNVEVPTRSRMTIKVNDVVGANKNVSAKLVGHEGDSIVVEQAMYWDG